MGRAAAETPAAGPRPEDATANQRCATSEHPLAAALRPTDGSDGTAGVVAVIAVLLVVLRWDKLSHPVAPPNGGSSPSTGSRAEVVCSPVGMRPGGFMTISSLRLDAGARGCRPCRRPCRGAREFVLAVVT